MKKDYPELNGAWEERGVIGTRIEIDKNDISILWRNSPVLETVFTPVERDGGIELRLKKSGLRNASDSRDYAAVTMLFYRDGKLEFVEDFPISGKSSCVLTKTENSRYGNYDIADGMLEELRGEWKSKDGFFEVVISGDEMSINGEKTRIRVLRYRDSRADGGRYLIVDRDPSVCEFRGLSRFEYCGGRLTTQMLICDAPPVYVEFEKVK